MAGSNSNGPSQRDGLLRQNVPSYQSLSNNQPLQDYEWNVEVDVKGQVDTNQDQEHEHENEHEPYFSWKKLMLYSGPGWLMAIAYLDPGNLESDLQSGAVAGYKLLWLLLWAHGAGLVIQILSARLGVVTGKHLAQLIRDSYSRPVGYLLWAFTQLAIIGSDIQEIVGTAIALKIIFGFTLPVGVLITAFDTFLFMWLQQYGVRKIEVFFMSLIGVMIACFWAEMISSHPSIPNILHGIFIPEIPEHAAVQAVGMVGAVIMPHNMFLHSALVMSRNLGEKPSERKLKEANFYFAVESGLALLTSYFINLAIVVVFAQVFYEPGNTLDSLPGLYDASEVLRNTLGEYARYLWAAGLLAAGQSSTMTGTLAGQYVVEGFFGAIFKKQWHRVALTRTISLVPSMMVAVLAVNRFDTLGEILNVLQSLCLPMAIIPILKLTSSSRIMTSTFKNSRWMHTICWTISWILFGLNIYLCIRFLKEYSYPPVLMGMGIMYSGFVGYLIYTPLDNDSLLPSNPETF